MNSSERDVDQVIQQVKLALPLVDVRQYCVRHPGVDDGGVWWFSQPEVDGEIQIESSTGVCPFSVEHHETLSTDDAQTANTIQQAVDLIVTYLQSRSAAAPKETFGTIVGVSGGCVVVQQEDGEEVLCRNVNRLHRPLGFLTVPIGRRVRIRWPCSQNRRPLILEVLDSNDA